MATTKNRIISPSEQVPSLLAKSGRAATDGVPLRWLETLVKSSLAAIPTEAERNTALVFGTEHLIVRYDDTLTPEEQTRDDLEEARNVLAEIKALLPREGEPLSAQALAQIRAHLGG